MAAETGAGTVVVTADAEIVARADRIVLPGDGAFPACRGGPARLGLFRGDGRGGGATAAGRFSGSASACSSGDGGA